MRLLIIRHVCPVSCTHFSYLSFPPGSSIALSCLWTTISRDLRSLGGRPIAWGQVWSSQTLTLYRKEVLGYPHSPPCTKDSKCPASARSSHLQTLVLDLLQTTTCHMSLLPREQNSVWPQRSEAPCVKTQLRHIRSLARSSKARATREDDIILLCQLTHLPKQGHLIRSSTTDAATHCQLVSLPCIPTNLSFPLASLEK